MKISCKQNAKRPISKIPELDSEDFDLSNEDKVKPSVLLYSDFQEPPEQDNVTVTVILEIDDSDSSDDYLFLSIV